MMVELQENRAAECRNMKVESARSGSFKKFPLVFSSQLGAIVSINMINERIKPNFC